MAILSIMDAVRLAAHKALRANDNMIEPPVPVTIWVKSTPYPAFLLANDEGAPVRPSSIILRHRHLRQQQRIIEKGVVPKDGPGARPMRGVLVSSPEPTMHHFQSNPGLPVPSSTADALPSLTNTSSSSESISPSNAPSSHSASVPLASTTLYPGSPTSASANPPVSPSPDYSSPLTNVTSPLNHQLPDPSSHHSPSSQSDPASALPHAAPAISPAGPSSSNNSSHGSAVKERRQIICTSLGVLEIWRTERRLRSRKKDEHKLRGEKTVWFYSRNDRVLDVPPRIPTARPGQLYVHYSKHGRKQMWLMDGLSTWQSVQVLHPHPYLEDYTLNLCNNGEPSWVTRDTIRTYKGRMLKAMRDAAKTPGHKSPP